MTHWDAEGRDDHYREWDAAYVLGALSPAERREFEDHLKECERCSVAVAEFAAMPGLLRSLSADDALSLLEGTNAVPAPDPALANILPRLTARIRSCRRVKALAAGVTGAVAAAAILVGASLASNALNSPTQPSVSVPLRQVTPGPLTANIELTSVKWGTKIEMICDYRAGTSSLSGSSPVWRTRYGLYVTGRGGPAMRVSTWTSGPGETVTVPGSIDTPLSDITTLEVRSLNTGTVLLSGNIGDHS